MRAIISKKLARLMRKTLCARCQCCSRCCWCHLGENLNCRCRIHLEKNFCHCYCIHLGENCRPCCRIHCCECCRGCCGPIYATAAVVPAGAVMRRRITVWIVHGQTLLHVPSRWSDSSWTRGRFVMIHECQIITVEAVDGIMGWLHIRKFRVSRGTVFAVVRRR